MSSTSLFLQHQAVLYKKLRNSIAIMPAGSHIIDSNGVEIHSTPASDFFYFTGLEDLDAIALFTTSHPQHKYVIFWKEMSPEEKIWHGPRASIAEIKAMSHADAVFSYADLESKLPEYLYGVREIYYPIGFEDSIYHTITRARLKLCQKLNLGQILPKTVHDLNLLTTDLRIRKNKQEIALIQKAIEITACAIHDAMSCNWENQLESALATYIDSTYIRQECSLAFPTIVACQENGTILHYSKNTSRIHKNDVILVDTGAQYQHYCGDITRTWPLQGKFTKPYEDIYNIVLHAQKSAIAAIQPGAPVPTFHEIAIQKLVQGLLDLKILRGNLKAIIQSGIYKDYYPHSTGHWLGLDVHDTGTYHNGTEPRRFRPGMIMTVEPGLYFPSNDRRIPAKYRGIGIRIEDDVLVTAHGNQILSASVPKELSDIQKAVQAKR